MVADVFDFCTKLFLSLRSASYEILNFLLSEYEFLGTTFTVYELVFGTGLVVVLGAIVLRWVVLG